MRREFYEDVQYDRLNREAALEDQRFLVGDQWDDIVRQRREAARKPTLTINRLPAFVAQIVGNRRLNETTLKVRPDSTENEAIAKVREGLLRNIQKISRADIAYDKALENAVICGIGNFFVELDYESDDVFDQKIVFRANNNSLNVIWDRKIYDPTGADADHVFEIVNFSKNDFKKRWPWATPAEVITDVTLRGDLRMNGWIAIDDVRVVNYWRMRTHTRLLALMKDGKTEDITDEEDNPSILANIAQHADGTPIMREVERKYAQMYICSGLDVLEGPYDLPISRVPVLRVPGWEVSVGEWKHRWGLVRFLKDPQRLHNFWRSVIAEKLMLTPRANWVAADTAVMGREQQWRQSHITDDPLLIYNAESGAKPERAEPAIMEPALLTQAELTTQDIKDISNIHEANLGMPSNEVSGAAIMARQRVSDTGTVLYHDNLNQAIEQGGMIANELMDIVYDAPRVIKVLGADGNDNIQVINDFNNPKSLDITDGKYHVTVTTGPSFATKRMESLAAMMNLAQSAPQLLALFADIYVEAQDWPKADEIARRIRGTLPPGLVNPKDLTPEQLQAQQGAQQSQAHQQAFAIATALAELQKTQAQAAESSARAANFNATAQATGARVQTEALGEASQAADRQLRGSLEAVKVAHETK